MNAYSHTCFGSTECCDGMVSRRLQSLRLSCFGLTDPGNTVPCLQKFNDKETTKHTFPKWAMSKPHCWRESLFNWHCNLLPVQESESYKKNPVLVKKHNLTFEREDTDLIRKLTPGVISIPFIVLPCWKKISLCAFQLRHWQIKKGARLTRGTLLTQREFLT